MFSSSSRGNPEFDNFSLVCFQYGHNKNACRRVLSRAQRNYVMQSYPAASIAARRPHQQPPPPEPVCEPHMPGPPPPHLPPHPPAGAAPTTPSKHWLVARLEKAYEQAGGDAHGPPAVAAPHEGRPLGGTLGFNPPVVHHGIYHGVQPAAAGPEPDPTVDQYQVRDVRNSRDFIFCLCPSFWSGVRLRAPNWS